jgi:hypothetical protein
MKTYDDLDHMKMILDTDFNVKQVYYLLHIIIYAIIKATDPEGKIRKYVVFNAFLHTISGILLNDILLPKTKK